MKRLYFIMGTRPEVIKLAPVIRAFQQLPQMVRVTVISTSQHREMLDQLLNTFRIVPDLDLNIMQQRQTLTGITVRALMGLDEILQETQPDMLFIQGDTTTVLSAALSAFYHHVPVAHVEAGLRSFDWDNPYPEEMNRVLTSHLTTIHFAPTESAKTNLLKENIPESRVFVTGNTVVDALQIILTDPNITIDPEIELLNRWQGRMILVTAHRRENHGAPLESICRAVQKLVETDKTIQVVYPVHLNPAVQTTVQRLLGNIPRVHLLRPQPYTAFIHLMKRSDLILTDSGGIQEEAPTLQKPVFVLREVTERPEAFEMGLGKIIGTDSTRIVREVQHFFLNPKGVYSGADTVNPYGDGHASERIVRLTLDRLDLK